MMKIRWFKNGGRLGVCLMILSLFFESRKVDAGYTVPGTRDFYLDETEDFTEEERREIIRKQKAMHKQRQKMIAMERKERSEKAKQLKELGELED